jgi:3-hydroxybutyryl-CoA dehydrogenase
VGIVGSGAVATGFARTVAPFGEVTLWARSEESAARARDSAGPGVDVVTGLDALSACTYVVESVVEDMVAKCELLSAIGPKLGPEAVLASTTSSLSIEGLAGASGRPERFAGIHLFNPVEKMKLVELAFPDSASADTRARSHALCSELGKTAVEVPDTPGFVVNRLLFPYLFNAVRLLERHDLDPATVDDCMKLGAGHPMGPLKLLDLVGLDVSASIGDSIGEEVPARVRKLVAAGRLGKKAGAGFYDY